MTVPACSTVVASGAARDRPELKAALDYLRPGDTLAVWKLDRLARSVRQLVETAEDLARREIGLRVLTQAITRNFDGQLDEVRIWSSIRRCTPW